MTDWASRIEAELEARRGDRERARKLEDDAKTQTEIDRAQSNRLLMQIVDQMHETLESKNVTPDAQEVFMDTASFSPEATRLQFGQVGWLLDPGTILTIDGKLHTCGSGINAFFGKYATRKSEDLEIMMSRLPDKSVSHVCRNLTEMVGNGRFRWNPVELRPGVVDRQWGHLIDGDGNLIFLPYQSADPGYEGWEPPVPAEDRLMNLIIDYLITRGE